jgi:hypothetical protein
MSSSEKPCSKLSTERIQTELNARLQLQAVMLGGPLIYLAPEEAEKVNARSGPDATQIGRNWELWKHRIR